LAALGAVGETPEREADDRVEEREDGAEQPERGVAQRPLAPDALADAADDLTVEEVHQVDGEQHDERVDRSRSHAGSFQWLLVAGRRLLVATSYSDYQLLLKTGAFLPGSLLRRGAGAR